MTGNSTRLDSGLPPEAPPEGVEAEAMKAAIAAELFGEVAGPVKIGRYEVQEAIGEGGMGVVYAALDPALGRRVALKLLSSASASNDRRHARMLREAQALARLSHPNVVQVHEVGEHEGNVFVAMELVDGLSLRDWLKTNRSLAELEDVFMQAGRGLVAAHEADLVHRDFKPTNVMVGADGRVRVLDFGLVQGPGLSTDSAEPLTSSPGSGQLTRTGAVMGTPAYMSPEQLRGETADARADQFSFCVTMFEALAGSRPYRFADLQKDASRTQIQSWAAIPRAWRSPLERGLSVDPTQRWPTMGGLLDVLVRRRVLWRRAPWLVGGGLLIVGAGVPLLRASDEPCRDLPLAPTSWTTERAAELRTTVLGTDVPYATDTWTASRARIDAFAEAWTDTRASVCASNPRPQSIACLDRADAVLGLVLEEFALVDASNVATIHTVPGMLESPTRCGDAEPTAFGGTVPIEHLGSFIAARASNRALRPQSTLALLDPIVDLPQLQGTDALAEALRIRGIGHLLLANDDLVRADFTRSLSEAQSSAEQARSLVSWIRFLADQERWDSARDGLDVLDAELTPQSSLRLRADQLELTGVVLVGEERLDEAIATLERCVQLRQEAGEPYLHGRSLTVLANALAESGDPAHLARAEAIYQREREDVAATLGEEHPSYAIPLYNLALLAASREDWESGAKLLKRAEEIERDLVIPNSLGRARTQVRLAEMLIHLESFEDARAYIDAAWPRLEGLPEDHSDRIAGLKVLASITMRNGEHAASLEHHEALASIKSDDLLIQHNLAYLSAMVGKTEAARAARMRTDALFQLAKDQLPPPMAALLKLDFRMVDARIVALEGRTQEALRLVESIEVETLALDLQDARYLVEHRDQALEDIKVFRESLQPAP